MMKEERVERSIHMKKIGFTYVALDLAGYKYGRMNDALDEKTKEKIMAG